MYEQVTEEYKLKAAEWGIWDSADEPKRKFSYQYPKEERVLVISGKASLTPDGEAKGEPDFTIQAGDAVTFLPGSNANHRCRLPHATEKLSGPPCVRRKIGPTRF